MSRVIKFRLYSSDWGKYVPFDNNADLFTAIRVGGDDAVALEQFTGLQDKNGVDIYEGDVISHYESIGQIVFEQGKFFTLLNKPLQGIVPTTTKVNFTWDHMKVIGNIHENPDLLEVTE